MSDFIDLGGGAALRPKEDPKILLNNGVAPKPISPIKFKKMLKKFNELGKLDRNDFNSGKELGQFVDFYNEMVKKKRQDYDDNEIHEISKWVARLETQKLMT